MDTDKLLIGRVDVADFPGFHLNNIHVKVDTGAFTSSIHCSNIRIDEDNLLICNFLDPEHPEYHNKKFTFDKYEIKKVKSSNGITEERYTIESNIELFGKVFPIKLTLTNRGAMKYPVLLGRAFLSKYFVVDSSKTNLSYNKKQ